MEAKRREWPLRYECFLCKTDGDVVRVDLGEGSHFFCLACALVHNLYCLWHRGRTTFLNETHVCLSCVDATVEAIGPDRACQWMQTMNEELVIPAWRMVKRYAADMQSVRPNLSNEMRVVWGIVLFSKTHHLSPERAFREILKVKDPTMFLKIYNEKHEEMASDF